MLAMLKVQKETACRIEVMLPSSIEEYAKNFLAIYNNVREDNRLLKVYNNAGNSVFVVVREDVKDAAIDWLEGFGEIYEVEKVKTITPLVPITCTDSDFDDYTGDVEFLELDFE